MSAWLIWPFRSSCGQSRPAVRAKPEPRADRPSGKTPLEPYLRLLPHEADHPVAVLAACQKSYSQPVAGSNTAMCPSPAGSGAASAGIGTLNIVFAGAHEAVICTT